MILPASQTTEQTAYDIVGKYNQNKVVTTQPDLPQIIE